MSSGIASSGRSYIPTLDGWRALAVGLVIAAHSTMTNTSGPVSAERLMIAKLASHAGYGVDIFFALSGYLICTLLLREKQRTETISLFRFYVRRAFRILPPILLYMVCVVSLSLLAILPHIGTREVLAVLFFYRNYSHIGTWYTAHFWSLAIEEQFYAVVPVCLLLANRKVAMRCAFALIALCIAIRWLEYSHGMFPGLPLQFRTENRFDGLLWGCLLALALNNPATQEWLRKRLTFSVFLTAAASATILLNAFTSEPFRRSVAAAIIPILIGHTVLHPDALVGRLLENRHLKWVGRLSYSLYIWQQLFLVVNSRPLGLLQAFPLDLLCPIVCASVSYYLLEKPMIKLGHRLAGSPGAGPNVRFD